MTLPSEETYIEDMRDIVWRHCPHVFSQTQIGHCDTGQYIHSLVEKGEIRVTHRQPTRQKEE
jgi:hypothetical protein